MTTPENGRVPPRNCRCSVCQSLADRYGSDPLLLGFIRRRLLQRGWAGSLDDVERAYLGPHA
jgi:hypothetical protein